MEFASFKRVSENGITAYRKDGSAKFIERGHKEWDAAEQAAGPYVPPPEPTAEQKLERARATAFLPKDDFILSALDLGVLSETDAEEATNGWPAGWDAFFEGKPGRERIEAKARWANATSIKRDAPLIERLLVYKDLTPEQVDALFGINV